MSYRYRAYPDAAQIGGLFTHASHARFVWNLAVEQNSYFRVAGRLSSPPNSAARYRQLAEARADNEWLAAGSSSVQQAALRDFDRAMKSFFGGSHRRPSWRKAGRDEGFCIRDVNVEKRNRRWGRVFVPKVGWLRFRLSRAMPVKTGMARVTLDSADRRKNWIEKTTTTLIREHDVIVLEDLRIKNMVRKPKPKPDPDQPGVFLRNQARAKAGLNHSIQRSCWGLFAQRLQDKATVSGFTVIKVNPSYSSQQCRACGHTATENRQNQTDFSCIECGHTNHADTNAAQVVLARGLAALRSPQDMGQDRAPARSARGNPEKSVARTTRTKAAA